MPGMPLRKIRSFVRRPGRMTQAQQRALDELMPRYAIPAIDGPLDLTAVFGREAPKVLDIGFGDGEALVTAAMNNADIDYLGVEVHEPGIGHCLLLLQRTGVTNVRLVTGDAVELLPRLAERSLAAVNVFFPDPWPKKRHHKRRLVQPDFVARAARVLEGGGLLHVATDWADYAEHVVEVLGAVPEFDAVDVPALEGHPLAFRAPSKFERRGRARGHAIRDLYFRRCAPSHGLEATVTRAAGRELESGAW